MIPATTAARPNSSLPAPLLLGARVEVAAGELETGGLGVPVAAGTVLFPPWLPELEPVPVGYKGVTCEAPAPVDLGDEPVDRGAVAEGMPDAISC